MNATIQHSLEPKEFNRLAGVVALNAIFLLLNFYSHTKINALLSLSQELIIVLMFAFIPFVGLALCWTGQPRYGLIISLGSFPAAIAININTQFFMPNWPPIEQPSVIWSVLFHSSLVLCVLSEAAGIVLSFSGLKRIHASQMESAS